MDIKRKRYMLFFIYFFMVVCVIMLFRIVVFHGEEYSYKASNQQHNKEVIKYARGKIYDRNMIGLVDTRCNEYSVPQRYDSKSLARHIIGSVRGDNRGTGGIEEAYDHILKNNAVYYLNSSVDGANNPIYNDASNVAYKKNADKNIMLSIDYHIQKIAEEELDKTKSNGAVCVMKCDDFSFLALASRKNYDQNNIRKYLLSEEGELIDRCMSSYDPGSIFKIVVMAAALEDGIVTSDYKMYCGGCVNIDGVEFVCHKKDGHGYIDMEEAFAKSCNIYFYNIGNMLGIEKIYSMAKKFSIGERILDLPWESKGNADILHNIYPNQIANISIGQGELLVTPVQATNMANIIANDGICKKSILVKNVVDSTGNVINNFGFEKTKRIISQNTSRIIKEAMSKVVTIGTAKEIYTPDIDICAKTGTAQTGWEMESDFMVHGWFVGFFPKENPRFSMTVFLENGKSSKNAAKVFSDIAKRLIDAGY